MFGSTEVLSLTSGKRTAATAQVSATYLLVFCCMAALLAPAANGAGVDSDKGFDARALVGDWWNWALAGPLEENPIADPDGRNCRLRQHGPIWFLAGNFGGGFGEPNPTVRRCRIPAGKALFIPLSNNLFWTPEDAPTLRRIRALANANLADSTVVGVLKIKLTVDGVTLGDPFAYRAQSPPGGFRFEILPGSILNSFGFTAGPRDPAVADGYWVLLNPLTPGNHTIRIQASASATGFSLDVTYHLVVG